MVSYCIIEMARNRFSEVFHVRFTCLLRFLTRNISERMEVLMVSACQLNAELPKH